MEPRKPAKERPDQTQRSTTPEGCTSEGCTSESCTSEDHLPDSRRAAAACCPARDRRRRHRLPSSGQLTMGHVVTGQILDYCTHGLGLRTERALAVGRCYRLSSGVPHPSGRYRVAWCRLVATETAADGEVQAVFHAGLTLTDRGAI